MSYLLLLLVVFCRCTVKVASCHGSVAYMVVEMSWPLCDSVLWTGGLVPRRQGMMVISVVVMMLL